MSQIRLEQITKQFDDKVILDNISLSVNEGEMIALVGPSGSGKTTALKLIAGLMDPTKGDIFINEESVTKVPAENRGAVIVFQDYLLFPHMTVLENIAFGLKVRSVKQKVREKEARNLIDLVQLTGNEHKYPKELSGGQKQRVAIARALAIKPKVLLLDEPFSNLDTNLRASMRVFIQDLQRTLKITTILVTHDTDEALMTSDRVAVLLNGEIVQLDVPKKIYEDPKTMEVADFFGDNNYIKGNIAQKKLKTSVGTWDIDTDYEGSVHIMIRPESIQFSTAEMGVTEGLINGRCFAGNKIIYDVKTEFHVFKIVCDPSYDYEVGRTVYLNFIKEQMNLYDSSSGMKI